MASSTASIHLGRKLTNDTEAEGQEEEAPGLLEKFSRRYMGCPCLFYLAGGHDIERSYF